MDNKFNWSKHFLNSTLLILFLVNIYLQFQVNSLNDKVDNLRSEIGAINRNIDNSIGNISYSVSQALEKDASLINSFNYEYGAMNNGRVDLKLAVTPKEISSENEYFFSYNLDGEEILVGANMDSPSEIVANINIPLKEFLEPNFIVKEGETRKIEALDYIYSLEENLLAPFNAEPAGYGLNFSGGKTTFRLDNARYALHYDQYEYREGSSKSKAFKSVKLYIELNGNVRDSFTMTKEDRPQMTYSPYTYELNDYSLSLKANDKLEIYAIAEHEDGYKVKIIFDSVYLDENGQTRHDMGPYMNEKSIIY